MMINLSKKKAELIEFCLLYTKTNLSSAQKESNPTITDYLKQIDEFLPEIKTILKNTEYEFRERETR